MTPEIESQFEEWLRDRPEVIKQLAANLKPWFQYKLNSCQLCTLHSYQEDGTVTVEVNGHEDEFLNILYSATPIHVFGIKPEDLSKVEAL